MPSVFVLEHGRLWLVAQRGYAVVPDGITVERGITGRAIRLGARSSHPTSEPIPTTSPRSRASSRSSPFRCARRSCRRAQRRVGARAPRRSRRRGPAARRALTPLAEALRSSRTLDLAALARLFVHLGSLREPGDIAALGAASLPKVLPVESQIVVWSELGAPTELAVWRSDESSQPPLSSVELEIARAQTDPSVVCQVLDLSADGQTEALGRSSGFRCARMRASSARW